LTAAYYQELLDLLDKAISSGDLSGGSAFDKSSLLKLESQAQSFASLPTGTAGVRVMDDSFNYPLSLLEARLKALAAEAGNFTTASGRLLDILANETRSLLSRAHNTLARGRGRGPGCGSLFLHRSRYFRMSRLRSQRPLLLTGGIMSNKTDEKWCSTQVERSGFGVADGGGGHFSTVKTEALRSSAALIDFCARKVQRGRGNTCSPIEHCGLWTS
jgi:hypothetical protein